MPDTASQYPLSDLFNVAGSSWDAQNLPPEIQYFVDKGYISANSMNDAGQETFAYNKQAIPKTASGQSFESFWKPGGISGALKTIDPSAIIDDPTFGKITDNKNQYQPSDETSWLYPLMEAGLGVGFGALTGLSGFEGTIFNTIGKTITTGQNPLQGIMGLLSGNKSGASTTSPTDSGKSTIPPELALLLALISGGGKGGLKNG